MAKYELIKNDEGFIVSMIKSDKGIEVDVSKMDLAYLDCYYEKDGKVILNEERKAQMVADEEKESRIHELETVLEESDGIMTGMLDDVASLNNPVTFISDFIQVLANYNSKYSKLIADRKAWRSELEELNK